MFDCCLPKSIDNVVSRSQTARVWLRETKDNEVYKLEDSA